jgi:hypothetical protein
MDSSATTIQQEPMRERLRRWGQRALVLQSFFGPHRGAGPLRVFSPIRDNNIVFLGPGPS